MRSLTAPASSAPNRLLGTLRTWLQTWSGESGPAPRDPPDEAEWPVASAHGSVRVLVVDDNPVNLMLISALMQSRGLVPMLAADGAEAVALASELRFDLILMDLQMPVLDGWEATAAIRRIESTSARPAVPIVTYSSTCPDAALLATHGMHGSLPKPCDDQDLERCLMQWCPAYKAAPAAHDAASANGGWQAAARNPHAGQASLR